MSSGDESPPARAGAKRARRTARTSTVQASYGIRRIPTGPTLERGTAASAQRIDAFAAQYGLNVPASWRRWCERQGWYRQPDEEWELLGLTPAPSGLDAAALLAGLRFTQRGFPASLVPIEVLPEKQVACLLLDGTDDPPVVLVDLDDPENWRDSQRAADRFSLYASEFEEHAQAYRRVTGFMRYRQGLIDRKRMAADQAPRPDDWRMYRMCSQNVVVALLVLRFNREEHVLEVGACLITALSRLDPDAPARAVCTLLFAESFRSGGDLAVRFTAGTHPDARTVSVPRAIVRWTKRVGVAVPHAAGVIEPQAALRIFVESLRVSDQLRDRLRGLPASEAAAVCNGIASGLWHPTEVEAILAWSEAPEAVLRGACDPLDRAAHASAILDVRSGMLTASAVRRVAAGEDRRLDAEDVQQDVYVTVRDDGTCSLTAAHIDLAGWLVGGAPQFPATTLRLAVADAEPDQIAQAVLPAIARLTAAAADGAPAGQPLAVLCPRDVLALDENDAHELRALVQRAGVMLLAAPEYTAGLTVRALDKLERARTARQ